MEVFKLHNPIDSSEAIITPDVPLEEIQRYVDSGMTIIREGEDGSRTVSTIEELPERVPAEEFKVATLAYVNNRDDLVLSYCASLAAKVAPLLDKAVGAAVMADLKKAQAAMASGETAEIEQAAADISPFEGPSIE